MKKNVGKIDRIIRVVLGLVIVGLGIYYQSWWGALGLLILFTGMIGWCWMYDLLKINTAKKRPSKSKKKKK